MTDIEKLKEFRSILIDGLEGEVIINKIQELLDLIRQVNLILYNM